MNAPLRRVACEVRVWEGALCEVMRVFQVYYIIQIAVALPATVLYSTRAAQKSSRERDPGSRESDPGER